MKRKVRDTSKKREAILEAAISVFIDCGYERTSMDMIADLAKSSKRTVYNHFPSKENLIEEAFNRFLQDAFEAKNIEYNPDRSIEDQLSDFADSKIRLTENPKRLGLMRVTLATFITHPHMAEKAINYSDSLDDGLITWLESAAQDGRLNVDDPKMAAEAFWSLFSGTFFWSPILRGPIEKKTGERLKMEFINLFLAKYGCDSK